MSEENGWGQSPPSPEQRAAAGGAEQFWGAQPAYDTAQQFFGGPPANPTEPSGDPAQQFWGGPPTQGGQGDPQPAYDPSQQFWDTPTVGGPPAQVDPAQQFFGGPPATPPQNQPQPASGPSQHFWDAPTQGGPQPAGDNTQQTYGGQGGPPQQFWGGPTQGGPQPPATTQQWEQPTEPESGDTKPVVASGPLIATRKDRILHMLLSPKVRSFLVFAAVALVAAIAGGIWLAAKPNADTATSQEELVAVIPTAPDETLISAHRNLRVAIAQGESFLRSVPAMDIPELADLTAAMREGESLLESRNLGKIEGAADWIEDMIPLAKEAVVEARKPKETEDGGEVAEPQGQGEQKDSTPSGSPATPSIPEPKRPGEPSESRKQRLKEKENDNQPKTRPSLDEVSGSR